MKTHQKLRREGQNPLGGDLHLYHLESLNSTNTLINMKTIVELFKNTQKQKFTSHIENEVKSNKLLI